MELPNVPIDPGALLNEYYGRLADVTAANIRLTVMVHELVAQRNDALTQMARLQEEYQQLRTETSGALTRIGKAPHDDTV